MNILKFLPLAAVCAAASAASAFETVVEGLPVGPVKVRSAKDGGWTFAAKGTRVADGLAEVTVSLSRKDEAVPPAFSVTFDVPQRDAHHRWTGQMEKITMPPNWSCTAESRLCSGLPLVSFLDDRDGNRILAATSEAKRKVSVQAGLREEDSRIVWSFDYFTEPEAPIRSYEVKIRLDTRRVYFGTAIREGMAWIERTAGIRPTVSPAAAFEPLYSSWYSFHQNVKDSELEAECAEAAKLGMKVLIVDDGWQTDDNNRGYAYCGDWEVSKRRFPDMAAHVKKVHALGMKYMMWYGVPMIGVRAKNFPALKDKCLWVSYGKWSDYGCLDPRFPEVRKFLAGLYEKAVREWDIDGLKLDFIDAIGFHGEDPAIRDNYAGRDIRAVPEAVDVLLREVRERLTAIKPDFLFEFRQSYIGPGIRQYGNMLRAGDCPGDLLANRCRTANLRLTSGATAVHADMLEWDVGDTPENAARYVLSTMFSTIQYSVMLRTLPEAHKRMISHWLGFSQKHRATLLKGEFRPHHFEAMYPWMEAEIPEERIVAVYSDATVADAGAADRPVYVLNATGANRVTLRLAARPTKVEAFDTFGNPAPAPALAAGVQDVAVPASGYLVLTYPQTATRAYSWRGYMLDVSRHFFTVEEVKKTLDAMALVGLNVFHWHLTDNEGWRVQIDRHPELTRAGAVRATRHGERCFYDVVTTPNYGPYFYTKDQIRDVIAYAGARGIRVVPEIEIPGHGKAAVTACPELGCKGLPNIGEYCIGSDRAIGILEDILDEVCELFPDEVVHIGGDECNMWNWGKCELCRKRVRDNGLKDAKGALQGWMTRHFARYLEKKGKRMMGWDQIVGFDLPKSAIVMSYRGTGGGIRAAKLGYDVVMTPDGFCYLDYSQGLRDDPIDCQPFGSVVSTLRCGKFNPVAGVPVEYRHHILGGQGSCWTEIAPTFDVVTWRSWPRAAALAKAMKEGPYRDERAFLADMEATRARLKEMGLDPAPLGPLLPEHPTVTPTPKKLKWLHGDGKLLVKELTPEVFDWTGRKGTKSHVVATVDPALAKGSFTLQVNWRKLTLTASDEGVADRALALLKQIGIFRARRGLYEFPSCEISY